MYPYAHIPRQYYQTNRKGELKVYATRLVIPLVAGTDKYQIEDKTRLVDKRLVGLRVEEPDNSGPQKVNATKTITTRAVFASTYLNLRDDTDIVLEGLPLRQIEKDNSNGQPYIVMSETVNLAESELYIANNGAIQANEVIVLIAEYVKPKGSK